MKYNKSLYPFQSKWINIQGHQIHYVDEGRGPVLLFSHPPIGSSFMYRVFIERLRTKYRCVALDYPGFGLSSDLPDQTYSIVTQSEILKKFIHRLGLNNIVGLGHDTGGPSLFKVAAEMPGLFRGLILTDTIIFPTKEYKRIHTMLGIVGSRIFRIANNRTNLLVRLTFSRGIRTRKLTREEKKQYWDLYKTKQRRKRMTDLLFSLRQHQAFMQEIKSAFEQQLNELPVLLIYGEKDPVHQMGIPERIMGMLQNASLHLIENEGHFPHEGQAEKMSELIHHWLAWLTEETKSKVLSALP